MFDVLFELIFCIIAIYAIVYFWIFLADLVILINNKENKDEERNNN